MHGAGSSGIVPQGGQPARYAEGPAVRRCHAPPRQRDYHAYLR